MKEETIRPWGSYKIIGKTKIIKVKPNQRLSLQYHQGRDEFWEIISGTGKVTINDENLEAKIGDSFVIPKKCKHRIESYSDGIEFIEIATGEVDEADIIRIEDDYNRTKKIDEKIIITSGYFDPLHKGHIECFHLAKSLGDKLIVILNNDEQLKLKKGFAFMPEEERRIILENLRPIDEVFMSIDNEDVSSCKSLKAVAEKYRGKNVKIIFAKGGDRYSYEIPEAKICREYGIEIRDGLGAKVQSSSWLIQKARELEKK